MPSISALDAAGVAQTIQTLPAVGPALKAASLPMTVATDDPLLLAVQAATPAGANLIGAVVSPAPVTLTVTVTRPGDTTAYAAGDAFSNSTSAPTIGTFTGAARVAGKSVVLSDIVVTSSAPTATALQGEVWIFDTAVTPVNDNAAFGISDGEVQALVEKVPFSLFPTANNACGVAASGKTLTTVGSANLFFLIRVTNAYVPLNGEVLTIRAKFLPVD